MHRAVAQSRHRLLTHPHSGTSGWRPSSKATSVRGIDLIGHRLPYDKN